MRLDDTLDAAHPVDDTSDHLHRGSQEKGVCWGFEGWEGPTGAPTGQRSKMTGIEDGTSHNTGKKQVDKGIHLLEMAEKGTGLIRMPREGELVGGTHPWQLISRCLEPQL